MLLEVRKILILLPVCETKWKKTVGWLFNMGHLLSDSLGSYQCKQTLSNSSTHKYIFKKSIKLNGLQIKIPYASISVFLSKNTLLQEEPNRSYGFPWKKARWGKLKFYWERDPKNENIFQFNHLEWSFIPMIFQSGIWFLPNGYVQF